jgi:hypothetical protein
VTDIPSPDSPAVPSCPADWETRFRRLVLDDRPFDMRMGFFLAYYRTFTTPESAAQVVKGGALLRDPEKRTIDTGVIIYEIIANGFDSERGEAATAIMNRAHSHVRATNEEFLYVLLSLLVVPVRWVADHARTPLDDAELASAVRFVQELGTRMHLTAIPPTYAAAAEFFDDFEERRVAPSDDIRLLFDRSAHVFGQMMPAPVRPFTRTLLSALMDDRRVNEALGLAPAPAVARRVIFAGAAVASRMRQPRSLRFRPGQRVGATYPRGYTMEQLGPDAPVTRSSER